MAPRPLDQLLLKAQKVSLPYQFVDASWGPFEAGSLSSSSSANRHGLFGGVVIFSHGVCFFLSFFLKVF